MIDLLRNLASITQILGYYERTETKASLKRGMCLYLMHRKALKHNKQYTHGPYLYMLEGERHCS